MKEASASEPKDPDAAPEDQQRDVTGDAPKEESQPASEPTDQADVPTSPHATDFAKPSRTPSPSPDEKPSIEKPDLLPIPEQSANTTADPSRLNTEELEADTRKRKRRSATPELTTQDIRAKKPRPSEDAVREVAPSTDEDTVMDQRAPEEAEKELDEEAMDIETTNGPREIESENTGTNVDESASQAGPDPSSRPSHENKDRYRDAFKPASSTVPGDTPVDDQDDRNVEPAMHAATSALYIRNFMRPLRPDQLQAHLVALASPPSADPDPTLISTLFLDSIKTHALVRFASITAASRVRASLHGTVWPPEGNRKALWVDFVPDADCADWITSEEDAVAAEKEARASGRSIPSKKFEVVYTSADDGSYTAVFQEVGTGASSFNPPTGPRRASQFAPDSNSPSGPAASEVPKATRLTAEQSFKTLDELFSSTEAKPKLYFLAVSDERAEVRAKELQMETSRDWTPEERRRGRGMQASRADQKLRYTFDDEDRVVEAGTDFGPWTEPGPGGARDRGGFRGRGRGRGGGWRGGNGGGWRSGP